jgi:hypothetical protein
MGVEVVEANRKGFDVILPLLNNFQRVGECGVRVSGEAILVL